MSISQKKSYVITGLLLFGLLGGWGCDSTSTPPMLDAGPGTEAGTPDGGNTSEGGVPGQCLPTAAPCQNPDDCCTPRCESGYCLEPATECIQLNQACADSSECCSGRCEVYITGDKVCVAGVACTPAGAPCTLAADCCTLACAGGLCVEEGTCAMIGEDCQDNVNCCSNICNPSGTCDASSSSCIPAGEACGSNAACCSDSCADVNGTMRCTMVSVCKGGGELCSDPGDCCSGICGTDGLCPVMDQCQTGGEPCTGNHECCSGLCADPGTGVPVCHFVSGCRPIGEVCLDNAGCCSAMCEPFADTGVNRCVKPGGCMDAGEVCWTGQAANCCPQGSGGGNLLCLPTDLANVKRCFTEGTPEQCLADGQPCAFADECCSNLCLPDQSGNLVCGEVGGGDCVPLAGGCTSDSDCCDGNLCLNGSCLPNFTGCVPLGGACTQNSDCCGAFCDMNIGKCSIS